MGYIDASRRQPQYALKFRVQTNFDIIMAILVLPDHYGILGTISYDEIYPPKKNKVPTLFQKKNTSMNRPNRQASRCRVRDKTYRFCSKYSISENFEYS